MLSDPPPGVEISLGSKQVRRVGWDEAVEAPGRASIDGSTERRPAITLEIVPPVQPLRCMFLALRRTIIILAVEVRVAC